LGRLGSSAPFFSQNGHENRNVCLGKIPAKNPFRLVAGGLQGLMSRKIKGEGKVTGLIVTAQIGKGTSPKTARSNLEGREFPKSNNVRTHVKRVWKRQRGEKSMARVGGKSSSSISNNCQANLEGGFSIIRQSFAIAQSTKKGNSEVRSKGGSKRSHPTESPRQKRSL